ncbi:hypothetical protein ACFSTC_19380 [Nonomuraea ferruginea]
MLLRPVPRRAADLRSGRSLDRGRPVRGRHRPARGAPARRRRPGQGLEAVAWVLGAFR